LRPFEAHKMFSGKVLGEFPKIFTNVVARAIRL
jgi:hypothetical protein